VQVLATLRRAFPPSSQASTALAASSTVLANPEGDYSEGAHPYWLSLAMDPNSRPTPSNGPPAIIDPSPKSRRPNVSAIRPRTIPMDLLLNADSMTGDEFTKRLNEARVNVVDAQTASTPDPGRG